MYPECAFICSLLISVVNYSDHKSTGFWGLDEIYIYFKSIDLRSFQFSNCNFGGADLAPLQNCISLLVYQDSIQEGKN